MVVVGTGGRGSQYINKNYPAVEGLTAGTTKLDGQENSLIPEDKDLRIDKWGSLD